MHAVSSRNFGVIVGDNFNFREHISQICRTCYYYIHDFRRILRLSVRKLLKMRYSLADKTIVIPFFIMVPLSISQNYIVQNCLAIIIITIFIIYKAQYSNMLKALYNKI